MSTARSMLISGAAVLVLGTASFAAEARGPVVRPAPVRAVVVHRHLPPAISPGEAARIRYQLKEHQQMKRRAHADGTVTRREQAILSKDAAQIRELIHTAKTN